MDWWFVVIYVSLLLVVIGVLASTPEFAGISHFACALSGDAASLHNYSNVHISGCPFSGNDVGGVPLMGRVALSPEGMMVYEWVGR